MGKKEFTEVSSEIIARVLTFFVIVLVAMACAFAIVVAAFTSIIYLVGVIDHLIEVVALCSIITAWLSMWIAEGLFAERPAQDWTTAKISAFFSAIWRQRKHILK